MVTLAGGRRLMQPMGVHCERLGESDWSGGSDRQVSERSQNLRNEPERFRLIGLDIPISRRAAENLLHRHS